MRLLGAAWSFPRAAVFEAAGVTTLPSREVVARATVFDEDARVLRFVGLALLLPLVALRVVRLAGVARLAALAELRVAVPEFEDVREEAVARRLETVGLVVVCGRLAAARRVVPSAVAVAVVPRAAEPVREPARLLEAIPVFDPAALRERVA